MSRIRADWLHDYERNDNQYDRHEEQRHDERNERAAVFEQEIVDGCDAPHVPIEQ